MTSREISRELSFVEPHGWTALYDATCLAAQQIAKAHNHRRVLVIFSDGGDNNSRYSESELISMLREADVRLRGRASLKSRGRWNGSPRKPVDARYGSQLDDLPAAVETLNRQIRSDTCSGTARKRCTTMASITGFASKCSRPRARSGCASWRRGYTAPGE